MAERRWLDAERTLSVAMCPPAVRMVIVVAGVPDGARDEAQGPWHYVEEVLCLRTRVVRRYVRVARHQDDYDFNGPSASERWLLEGGWRFNGEEAVTEPMGLCEGGLATADEIGDCGNCRHEVAVAPWPPAEDPARLAGVVARLQREAAAKVAGSRQAADRGANP